MRFRTVSVTGIPYTEIMTQTASLSSAAPRAPRNRFVVGLDANGQWIVQDERGVVGGVFADRAAALRFASLEGDVDDATVTILPEDETLTVSHRTGEGEAPFRRTVDALLI